jgi:hypothetical protein
VGVDDRLRRLRDQLGHVLCEGCYYAQPVEQCETMRFVYPDGSERRERDPRDAYTEPPPLCDTCPYGPGGALEGEMPLGAIEVVLTVQAGEGGDGQLAPSGATLADNGHGPPEQRDDTDGASETTDANVAPMPEQRASTPEEIAAERARRWQQQEDAEHAADMRRGRTRGSGPRIDPADFGLELGGVP